VKPAPFRYHRPALLADALALLAAQPNARVLAGGQSLMPMLNLRLAAPDDLVDIGRIPELAGIREHDGAIEIGAMTRQREVEQSALVRQRLPLLSQAIALVGHQQTRNWGTVGGSLCHLDPSAEIPTVAMAFDATLLVQSAKGQREVPMRDFAQGLMTTVLASDEMLVAVRFAPWAAGHACAFVEHSRRHGDFAVASAAVMMVRDGAGRIARLSLTLGGTAVTPVRLSNVEEALRGRLPDADALDVACAAVASIDAIDDKFVPAWYRSRIAATMLRRAWHEALATPGDGK
jgi:carbon-monoxide dehydrogenase medium subunit